MFQHDHTCMLWFLKLVKKDIAGVLIESNHLIGAFQILIIFLGFLKKDLVKVFQCFLLCDVTKKSMEILFILELFPSWFGH